MEICCFLVLDPQKATMTIDFYRGPLIIASFRKTTATATAASE